MASSKDVLTVVGMLCLNRRFRDDFFADPVGKAQLLVGKLRGDEIEQVQRLAWGGFPDDQTRTLYVQKTKAAYDRVYTELDCSCPTPPCPCPPTDDLYSAMV